MNDDPSLAQFLSACGSAEPLRVGVGSRDELQSETWSIGQPFLVIGRSAESDLRLDHWQVSRRHAYLQLIDGRFYCLDLGSRTGTHGGDASERSGWLERGRAIQIGPFTVRPEWPAPAPREPRELPGVTWELPSRAISQALWRMDQQVVLVGRSASCRVRIVEPDVSKIHCSLVLTPMGVWVVDLLGQKGVRVNGRAARCARLEDGDELQVGRHALRPRYDVPPPPLPHPGRPAPAETEPDTEPGGGLATIVAPSFGMPPAPGYVARMPGGPGFGWPAPGSGLAGFEGPPGAGVDPTVPMLVHQFGLMQQQMFDQFHQTMMMMFEGFAALHREQSGALREEFEEVRKLSGEIESLRSETARLADEVRSGVAARPPANGHAPVDARAGRAPTPDDPVRRASPPPPDPEVDIHAQLCRRLASIETERQNRWQKILGMMSSRS